MISSTLVSVASSMSCFHPWHTLSMPAGSLVGGRKFFVVVVDFWMVFCLVLAACGQCHATHGIFMKWCYGTWRTLWMFVHAPVRTCTVLADDIEIEVPVPSAVNLMRLSMICLQPCVQALPHNRSYSTLFSFSFFFNFIGCTILKDMHACLRCTRVLTCIYTCERTFVILCVLGLTLCGWISAALLSRHSPHACAFSLQKAVLLSCTLFFALSIAPYFHEMWIPSNV